MKKIAIGIDVAKGKSMVSAVGPSLEILAKPYHVLHTECDLRTLVKSLQSMDGELRAVMEATGHYHEPVAKVLYEAGIFVSIVNPYLVKVFGNNTLRKVKTDKADAVRIARYGMHYWSELRQYAPADDTRGRLKEINRQFLYYTDRKTAQKDHLLSLLDRTYPEVRCSFGSKPKANGQMKWVDFVETFWHCDIVNQMDEDEFVEIYRVWCRENSYDFTLAKAAQIYRNSSGHICTMPKNEYTEALVAAAARQLTSISQEVEYLRWELCGLAEQLPEYPAATKLLGTGKSVAAQFMAEIGDVRNYKNGKALVAFAGLDPGRDQSGIRNKRSVSITKNGNQYLRRTLMGTVERYIKQKPPGEPVYEFYKRKRGEGKHYYVCRTAAAHKLLRIYFARVREYLEGLDAQ